MLECDRSVQDIADALSEPGYSPARTSSGLSSGNAGLAVFYGFLYATLGNSVNATRRDNRWNAAVDQLAEISNSTPTYYGGYTGIGWAAALLAKDATHECRVSDDNAVFEELEEALIHELETLRAPSHYDLVRGFVGWGLFSLERWPHPRAQRGLELIVDLLEARAEPVRGGVRWLTAPQLLTDWQRGNHPKGYWNLGVAHGIPAIWYLLAHAIARGIRVDSASRLLEGSVEWVLSQKVDNPRGLMFPLVVSDRKEQSPALLAWCYGDLGLSAALLVAARCTGQKAWEFEAVSIARNAARVSIEDGRVRDTCLCHGASGIGHIFNRLYQATGEEVLRRAARGWLKHTLAMRLPTGGIAGYAAWVSDSGRADGTFRWEPRPGLLDGAAGTALALLAAAHGHEPTWDRFLCISPVPIA